jgi:single-stranded DNA-binding protein
MNTYVVNGRVAKEAQLDKTQSGTPRLTLTIISKTHVKEGDNYLSHSVNAVFYGTHAELLSTSVTKGTPLIVSGEMATRKYKGKDGEIRYYEFLRVNYFDFLESREMSVLRQSNMMREENGKEAQIGREDEFEE